MAGPTYYDTRTNGTSTICTDSDTSYASSNEIYYTTSTCSETRNVLVSIPESWDEKTLEKWIKLINEDTSTGWRITLIIKGDIKIIDPRIETRSMEEFIPLLKYRATKNDKYQIDKFIELAGLE